MENRVTFNIAPVPASRARVTRWSTYYPARYSKFRVDLGQLIADLRPTPTSELLYVKLNFYVQIPKSWPKKRKAEKEAAYCDNNADIDNYIKAVLDSCEGHYYHNDKQIVMIRAVKRYSNNARIEFESLPIEDVFFRNNYCL